MHGKENKCILHQKDLINEEVKKYNKLKSGSEKNTSRLLFQLISACRSLVGLKNTTRFLKCLFIQITTVITAMLCMVYICKMYIFIDQYLYEGKKVM